MGPNRVNGTLNETDQDARDHNEIERCQYHYGDDQASRPLTGALNLTHRHEESNTGIKQG